MFTILQSDDLVVPSENSVFEVLTAWSNDDRKVRTKYVDGFRELVHFPFLKLETVDRLERTRGSLWQNSTLLDET